MMTSVPYLACLSGLRADGTSSSWFRVRVGLEVVVGTMFFQALTAILQSARALTWVPERPRVTVPNPIPVAVGGNR